MADYRELKGGSVIELPHTEVDPSMQGRGLGAVLVKAVLDDLMERDVTVVPSCWYVAAFLDQHPEYERLRS